MLIRTILALFLLMPSAFALYVSCPAIDCDCKAIEAGILTGGWRKQCRLAEAAAKTKCEEVGYWTPSMGYCDPGQHGPRAFPLGKEFGTTSDEINTVLISNGPWHLVRSLLPEYVSAEAKKEGLKAFNKVNTLFVLPISALKELYANALYLRSVQPNRPDLVRMKSSFTKAANEVKSFVSITKKREEYVTETYNSIPENFKIELPIKDLTDYMIHMTHFSAEVFRALNEFYLIVLEGTRTETSRIDVNRLNTLITRIEALSAKSPFKESYGRNIYTVMVRILPELTAQMDYLWINFKL